MRQIALVGGGSRFWLTDGTVLGLILTLSEPACLLTKEGERAAVLSSSTPQATERASAWKLGATGDLLQGPAIAIRITKIRKRPPGLHVDLTDVNASFDQFLADGFHVRDHHEKPFE
jgi:hypothetical protein